MKRPALPRSGQGLLEAIIGIGIILAGTVGTITLMMSTIKANRSSIDKAVAANLARESIETARNFRDTNWLSIQSNTDAVWNTPGFQPVGSFDDLFDIDDATPHHIRIPVFIRYLNSNDYQCRNNPHPDGLDSYTWHFEDPSDFYNYNAVDGNYTQQVTYNNGYDAMCTYKYRGVTTFRCTQVFQNNDVYYGTSDTLHGVGYGYFNQLPPYYDIDVRIPITAGGDCNPVTPLAQRACDHLSKLTPLVDESFVYYAAWHNNPADCATDIASQRTVTTAVNPLKVTTATRYQRWIKIDPVCRLDVKDKYGSGSADGIPDIPATERVEADEEEKCGANEIMVGLRLQSNVCWDDCPANGSKTVMVEDRLYNWKYVK